MERLEHYRTEGQGTHDVIKAPEVASLLGTTPYEVYRMAKRKTLPSWCVGSARRFSRRAILAWRDAGGTATAA
ncbi:MAG: helix-turn-helix domain-containing protein [Gemmatimonadaceae bacterium]|nr:helix-turn-helix domain-containing protein [Gemmatimonadaceae bacterium]